MAVRYDDGRKRWLVEFEQAGVRVFRRLPKGATEPQAKAYEVKLRREIFDRETLHKIPALTLQDAIDQWLREDHRRKDRKKMASEAKQWAPFITGKLLRDVPEIVQSAIATWRQSLPQQSDISKPSSAATPQWSACAHRMTKSASARLSSASNARMLRFLSRLHSSRDAGGGSGCDFPFSGSNQAESNTDCTTLIRLFRLEG